MSVGEYRYCSIFGSPSQCSCWRRRGTWSPPPSSRLTATPPCSSWSSSGLSNNKLFKIVDGNKTRGYNLGMWNCRRGLIAGNGVATSKLDEIKLFIAKRKLHMLCVIEADLHSSMSKHKRRVTVTKK